MRPVDAAALVLVRHDPGGVQVLMGQRHGELVFMPNKVVFPGGRLDAADYRIAPATALRPGVAESLARGCGDAKARALAMTAIRETFEETGLLVGQRSEAPPKSRSRSWGLFLAHGVVPSLEILDFVARAITPPDSPRRYDARFFLADARHVQFDAHDELAGSGELLELQWVPLAEAKTLDLPEVTHLVVDEVAKRLAAPGQRLPVPFFRYRRDRAIVDHL